MHNNAEVFALLGCYGTYVDTLKKRVRKVIIEVS